MMEIVYLYIEDNFISKFVLLDRLLYVGFFLFEGMY